MSRFAAQMNALSRRLPLAGPARDRVLLEVAADLAGPLPGARGRRGGAPPPPLSGNFFPSLK